MKTLLILRHAKSSWKNALQGDHERPLNGRGRRDAPRMGQLLADEDLVPQAILSSDAVRTRETVELAGAECGFDGHLRWLSSLYHGAPEDYVDALRGLGDEVEIAMVVGHNPGLQLLVEELSGRDETFPTAALARIRLPVDRWSELGEDTDGALLDLWRPRELR